MRKWKSLFGNACKCISLISTTTEFWNLCQVGTNASVRSGFVLKKKIIVLQWSILATFNVEMNFHVIFMTYPTLVTEHLSYRSAERIIVWTRPELVKSGKSSRQEIMKKYAFVCFS
jgi:hypothetical protein